MKTENTITLISISSGFGNVPNNVIPLHTYNHTSATNSRPGSGYDKTLGTFVLPNGCVAISDEYETIVLSPEKKLCTFGEEKDGTVWISWNGGFRILKKAKSDLKENKYNLEKRSNPVKEDAELAKIIRESDEWNLNALAELCERAGLLEEWNESDGDTFESVAYRAAEILGVEI